VEKEIDWWRKIQLSTVEVICGKTRKEI